MLRAEDHVRIQKIHGLSRPCPDKETGRVLKLGRFLFYWAMNW